MSATVPAEPLVRLTVPSAPTGTITRFGTVSPAPKFRFDEVGSAAPSGYAVMKPPALGAVTVTFSTTAVMVPGAGAPATPLVTSTAMLPFAGTGLVDPPV